MISPTHGLAATESKSDPVLVDEFRTELRRAHAVSFDVFDTLVYRPGLFSPKDLFYLVAQDVAGILGREAPDFVQLRIQAEKDARVRAWGRRVHDVQIADIYRELGRRMHVRGERLDRMIQSELDRERSVLVAQEQGRQLLHVARESGKPIVIVSDTYFSRGFVEEVLRTAGYEDSYPVLASSDHGKTKDEGSLYRIVIQRMGVPPDRLLHVGDNVHSDFVMALGQGMRAFLLPTDKGRMRSLHSVPDVPSGNPFSSSVLSEVSARFWGASAGAAGTLTRSSVRLAVLYLAFATWLIRRSSEAGCRTVYFASRDGLIMKRFFDLVAKAAGIDVRSRYLYVSRMALYPSLIYSDPQVARELLAHSWGGLTVRSAIGRMALSYSDSRTLLDKHGIGGQDQVLDGESSEHFVRFLRDAWPLVMQANEGRYALAKAYLQQEGVLSEEPAAFVDIGWHGSLQNCLVKLLGHLGIEKELRGYYVATFARPPGAAEGFSAEGYLLNNDEPGWLSRLVRSGPSLLELFHGASHGGVVGYERDGEEVVPVLDDDSEEPLQFKEFIAPVQEAAFAFVSELMDSHRGSEVLPLPRDLVARIALGVIYQPDASAARLFGRLRHAADFGGELKSVTGMLEWDLSKLGDAQCFEDGSFPLWPPGFQVLKGLGPAHRRPHPPHRSQLDNRR